jgi:hypothetical protein
METMKVRNKRPSLVTLPAVKVSEEYPLGFGAKGLKPGINVVSTDYLQSLQGNEMVELLFSEEHGYLELVDKGEPLVPDGVRDSLKGTSVANAEPLIADSNSIPQLERWMHADDRAGIHRAIAKRLDELEGETETKTED